MRSELTAKQKFEATVLKEQVSRMGNEAFNRVRSSYYRAFDELVALTETLQAELNKAPDGEANVGELGKELGHAKDALAALQKSLLGRVL